MELTKDILDLLYNNLRLTAQEIGNKFGMSRQGVMYHLNKHNISKKGEKFTIQCDNCGKEYSITRKKHRNSSKHFCSNQCKGAYFRSAAASMEFIKRKTLENTLKTVGREIKFGEFVVQDGSKIKIYPNKTTYFNELLMEKADKLIKEAKNA